MYLRIVKPGLLLLVITALFLSSCSRKKVKPLKIDPNFGSYISAFTSGQVSKKSAISIVLANDCPTASEANTFTDVTYFRFSPALKGKTRWLNKRMLEFIPDEPLKSGEVYTADFFVSRLVKVPASYKIFQFQFQVKKLDYNVVLENPQAYSQTRPEWQKLKGRISTSDYADGESIKKIITARQEGRNLSVRWYSYGNTHEFTIDSLARSEQKSKVTVAWHGKPLGLDYGNSREIELPALGDFIITNVKVSQEPELSVTLSFSDPLKPGQDLNGIIRLDGVDNLTYSIRNEQVLVYLPDKNITGTKLLHISNGIKNYAGYKMLAEDTREIYFEEPKPAVQLLGKGTILPNSGGLILRFQAVNLKAVDVCVTRIYEKNIPQFLQVNELDGKYQLKRVGKEVIKKKIDLDKNKKLNLKQWNSFTLDLKEMVAVEPGAIYRVTLRVKQEYSMYPCEAAAGTEENGENNNAPDDDGWNENDWQDYYYEYENGYGDGYEEENHSSPCEDYYYRWVSSRNILASDVGIIAKAGEDKTFHVFTSNLIDTKPLAGVRVEFYDYTQQVIATVITDAQGMGSVKMNTKPFMLIAKNGRQRGYLKLQDGASLSLSKFDVSGVTVQKGIKGFIYGERSVWRPGDSLYLTFVMEDKQNLLPETYPVSFELINPQGQVVKKHIRKNAVQGFYDFRTATDEEAPTGNWEAKISVGNRTFHKELKIETVKPNRLKIYFDFGKELLSRNDAAKKARLKVKWLHGAIAGNLDAKVDVTVNHTGTSFDKFRGYDFDDPTLSFSAEQETVFDGTLNDAGEAEIGTMLKVGDAAPGMLRAYFTTRVTEEGGDFSIDRHSVLYSPYTSYAGIRAPEGKMYRGTLETDKDHYIDVATVSSDGKPVSRKGLELKVYQLEWRWWYDSYEDDMASYISRPSTMPIIDSTISTVNGKGGFKLRINRPQWGRFFVKITDSVSGHSCGKIIMIDWPYWARANRSNQENATMLNFSSDKEKYVTGQNIKLAFPSPSNGRALVSVESSKGIVKKYWVETVKGETKFEFPATAEMTPNVFIHVTLMQPHTATKNDLPIRLYGVIPVLVENPNTHLHPVITMAEALRPESSTAIKVKEEKGLPMSYTLAVVDEGLLDLTRFQTPDPWDNFYQREALGVKTWDIYDMVIGAYAGRPDRIFSIGGDEAGLRKKAAKANRFRPMVKYIGPFFLQAGQEKTHMVNIPNYVGSVRVMVVAGYNSAYGKTEKTVAVKKPLMVLATLPRVLGPSETVQLPVNVFAMEKNVKSVNVEVITNDLLTVEGSKTKNILFSEPGDEVITFKVNIAGRIGIGKVKIIAVSGNEKAVHEIEIDVRASNPKVTDVQEFVLEPGKIQSAEYMFRGMEGTNKGTLEISSIPPIDLQKRLDYLIQYPHGCIEQTTSSVFPQIALGNVTELSEANKRAIAKNIQAGINRLRLFQTSDGGLAYWPGQPESNQWGSSYGGHFLMEAEKKGYTLPLGMKSRWVKYQQAQAKSWVASVHDQNFHGYSYSNELEQAYRLYTLALSGSPELGSMNRLRELPKLSEAAAWRLAAAYQLIGQHEVALDLVKKLPADIKPYSELSQTYGSDIRDEAMILETLSLLNERALAAPLAVRVAKKLGDKEWLSTQETAYSLIALSYYLGRSGTSNTMKFAYALNNSGMVSKASTLPVFQVQVISKSISEQGKLLLENKGSSVLYARLIIEGVPATGDQSSAASKLKMVVSYTNLNGTPLDPARIIQGTDFIASVSLTNPDGSRVLERMALTQIFPSGWEIHNSRMDGSTSALHGSIPEYQDIRDDRINTYYLLGPGENQTFRVLLNATYQGKFYLPTVISEAMYDNSINARVPGKWVEVVPQVAMISKR
jgi:uncharacterized protein YfaS (alpha-2-macroglobulin family)